MFFDEHSVLQELEDKELGEEAAKSVHKDVCYGFKSSDLADNLEVTVEALPSAFAYSLKSCLPTKEAPIISERKNVKSAGFFPKSTHCYYICESVLHILESTTGNHQTFSIAGLKINSAGFINSNPAIFGIEVDFMMILAGQDEVIFYGVKTLSNGGLEIYETDFSVKHKELEAAVIQTTEKQRIFIGSKNGSIYELLYQAQNDLFRDKCSLVNCTSSYFSFLPFFPFSESESITQLLVDNSRNVLYSLSSKSSLSVISLGSAGDEFNFIEKAKDYQIKAGSLSQNPENPSVYNIARIELILPSESRTIRLVAVTYSGSSLFFKPSKANCSGQASGLELHQVRSPFAHPSNAGGLVSLNSFFKNKLLLVTSQTSNESSSVEITYNESLPHLDTTKPYALHASLSLEGSVYDIVEVLSPEAQAFAPSASIPLLDQTDDFKRQYYFSPRKFLILSSLGVYTLTKNRPIDMLFDSFYPSSSLYGSFQSFVDLYGQTAICAMYTAFLSLHPTTLFCINRDLKAENLSLRSKADDFILEEMKVEINKFKKEYWLQYCSTSNNLLDTNNTLDPQIAGLKDFVSQIIHPIATLKLFRHIKFNDKYEFTIPHTSLKQIQFFLLQTLQALSELDFNIPIPSNQLTFNDSLKTAFEKQNFTLVATRELINLSIEALSLIQLLTKYGFLEVVQLYSKLNYSKFPSLPFGRLLHPMSSIFTSKLYVPNFTGLSLDQLIHPISGQSLVRDLVYRCIEYHINNISKECLLFDEVRAACPKLFDGDSILVEQGMVKLGLARNEPLVNERMHLLKESNIAFIKTKSILSDKNLIYIAEVYIMFGYGSGVLDIIANQIKKDPTICQRTETLNIFLNQALDLMLSTLKKNLGKEIASDVYKEYTKSLTSIIETCNNDIDQCIYRFLLDNDLKDLLFELRPIRLNDCLLSSGKPEDLLRLVRYQVHLKQFYDAGLTYLKLANFTSPLSILNRLEYLQFSVKCFDNESRTNSHEDKLLMFESLRDYIRLAQIQVYIADQAEELGMDPSRIDDVKNQLLSKEQLGSKVEILEKVPLGKLLLDSFDHQGNQASAQKAWACFFESLQEQILVDIITFKRKLSEAFEYITYIVKKPQDFISERFITKTLVDMSLVSSLVPIGEILDFFPSIPIPYFRLLEYFNIIYIEAESPYDQSSKRETLFDTLEFLISHPVFKQLSTKEKNICVKHITFLAEKAPEFKEKVNVLIKLI